MSDAFDNDVDVEEAADEEVNKIIDELTVGLTTAKVSKELPAGEKEEESDLSARLGALKS